MQPFELIRAADLPDAVRRGALARTAQQGADVRFLAGGTTLVDLMKLDVEQPRQVVDVSRLSLDAIEPSGDGLRVGAMVRNTALANDERIVRDYPVLSQAILAGASVQLRNMATTGGNLLQRTRCVYFRDPAMACNKRRPGSGCPAKNGYNRNLAILGTSEHCIASNPSDMNIALAALEATVHIEGPQGARQVIMADFHVPPGDAPERETVLEPGELITHVSLPPPRRGARSHYLKLRDRASYEFALASTAVIAHVEDERIAHVRIALGGVGTVPWRAGAAERALHGRPPTLQAFEAAAAAELAAARPRQGNRFKVALAQRCLVHALAIVTGLASSSGDVE